MKAYLISDSNGGNLEKEIYEEIRKEIQEKWKSSDLFDGITGHIDENIAKLYESETSCIINESLDKK